jgi:signal transduction histidine kinase
MLALIEDNFRPLPAVEADDAEETCPSVEPIDIDATIGSAIEALLEQPKETATPADRTQAAILVVDDDADNRNVLTRGLTAQGHAVVEAEDGRQALDAIQAGSFDLVLLDIMMPEMDGFEVLRRLKSDALHKHIPIIMVSAAGELDAAVRCIELGADDYLPKPFDRTLLKARTGACLERKRAHDRETRFTAELQESYRRLQEVERMRDDLTHMMVHDLRTPLTSVITGMQTLPVVGDLNETQQEVARIATSGGETLLGMINDLLDVQKMESGEMQLDYADVSPAELVASAVGQVASLAESAGLSIDQHVRSDLPTVRGDADLFRRTLVNLLGNAIKFSPEGGTVTVAAEQTPDAGSLEFRVTDTGEGIPLEAFDRIFEKFGQVETRRKGRAMSTGLGLTFCKLAVEAHGGSIAVESALGRGSVFFITVPLAPPARALKTEHSRRPATGLNPGMANLD